MFTIKSFHGNDREIESPLSEDIITHQDALTYLFEVASLKKSGKKFTKRLELKKGDQVIAFINLEDGGHDGEFVELTSSQIRQVRFVKERMNLPAMSDALRRSWRVFWLLLERSKDKSLLIITDGEPMRNGTPIPPADNEILRINTEILL
jgi:hypothetical protein